MPQILPGLGEQLGPALGTITETALDIIKPNRKIQEAMQAALATNPSLLQQFASIERASPGTAAALGLGPQLSSIIAAAPETTEAIVDRETRATTLANAKKKGEVDAQALEIQGKISESTLRLLATQMAISVDAARRMLNLPTAQQEKAGEQALEAGAQEIDLNAERLKEVARIEELRMKIPALQERGSMREIVTDFMQGKLNPLETTALFSTPEMAQGFSVMMNVMRNEQEDTLRRDIASQATLRSSTNRDELTAAFKVQQASMAYRAADMAVGTLDTWEQALFDPEKMELVDAFIADPNKEAKPEELAFKEIADYKRRMGTEAQDKASRDKTYELARLTTSISSLEKTILPVMDKDERESKIISLNQLLEQRAALGGPVITARYDTGTGAFNFKNQIYYFDKDGRRLSNKEIASVVRNPGATETPGSSLDPIQTEALNVIMSSGNKQATLDKLRLEEGDVFANKIRDALIAKGVQVK